MTSAVTASPESAGAVVAVPAFAVPLLAVPHPCI